ncbi:hypothetical protein [Lentibacillus daqui]|nr:hypothetical protein [Lentibacillus daqui]
MVTVVMQFVGVIVKAKGYLNMASHNIHEEHVSQEVVLRDNGAMSFDQITNSLWFVAPMIQKCMYMTWTYMLVKSLVKRRSNPVRKKWKVMHQQACRYYQKMQVIANRTIYLL